ncbi:hypothetical protein H4582DRAFT_2053887 [Lactarius indigo]|nr:hypothetical protein H4582DRAFT_2053887 [Lactarius indigo]
MSGQALASIGNVSWMFGRVVWIPVILVFLIATCVSDKHFADAPAELPATVSQILNFGAAIASFTITWATFCSDFATYFCPDVLSWRIFWNSCAGLIVPTSYRPLKSKVALRCLGAAAVITTPVVAGWEAECAGGNVGGLIDAVLQPVGKYRKVLLVLISLNMTGNNVPTIYSFGMSFQIFILPLVVVPRYTFSMVTTALHDTEAIAQKDNPTLYFGTAQVIFGTFQFPEYHRLLGRPWGAAVLVEYLYFCKGDFALYDLRSWNVPSKLPLGAAALTASALGFALVIPSMDQMAMAVTALLYVPLRQLEKRWKSV